MAHTGIDTGYNSVGIPILSQIPGINRVAFVGGDRHLEKAVVPLRTTVSLRRTARLRCCSRTTNTSPPFGS